MFLLYVTLSPPIVIVILSILCLLCLFLLSISSTSEGILPPLLDEHRNTFPNSINEKRGILINGIEQKFFLRGENKDNPIILFLHSGPATPELPLIIKYEGRERLERYFTVCYWDQRGAGMTCNAKTRRSELTPELLASDANILANYLCERFGKEKIFLMGHSWGSYLSRVVLKRYPERFKAYVGVGQVTNQYASELLCYKELMKSVNEHNDRFCKWWLQLSKPGSRLFLSNFYVYMIRNSILAKYGYGIMHNSKYAMFLFAKDVIFFNGYTIKEKLHYLKGMLISDVLYKQVIEDVDAPNVQYECPFFIVHGKYDYLVSEQLSYEFFNSLDVPQKEYIRFDNSAHSPLIEEPMHFVEVVKGLLLKHV